MDPQRGEFASVSPGKEDLPKKCFKQLKAKFLAHIMPRYLCNQQGIYAGEIYGSKILNVKK